jgi:hypothetical protein
MMGWIVGDEIWKQRGELNELEQSKAGISNGPGTFSDGPFGQNKLRAKARWTGGPPPAQAQQPLSSRFVAQ